MQTRYPPCAGFFSSGTNVQAKVGFAAVIPVGFTLPSHFKSVTSAECTIVQMHDKMIAKFLTTLSPNLNYLETLFSRNIRSRDFRCF